MTSRISKREQRRLRQIRKSRNSGQRHHYEAFTNSLLEGCKQSIVLLDKPFRAIMRLVFQQQKTLGALILFCLTAGSFFVFRKLVIERGLERLPEKVEILSDEPSLKRAVEKRINELLATSHKKGVSRKQLDSQLDALFPEFPAVALARQKFLLNGTLQVKLELHDPLFELEDSEGKIFVFNKQLALLGQNPIVGLQQARIRLRLPDKRLSANFSKSHRLPLKPSINHRYLYSRSVALLAAKQGHSATINTTGLEYSEENGFSFCLHSEAPICPRVILGPDPDLQNLEDFMNRIASKQMDQFDSADLRVPGRALIRALDSATKSKEGVE